MTRVEDKHIDIDSVKVNGRVRKDLGDLEPLKKSIVDRGGLLHPIVVAPDRTLICGARRLEACRQLGWRSLPVTFKDDPAEAHQVEAERIATESDENTCRLDMKPSEMVALTERLKAYEENSIDQVANARKARAVQTNGDSENLGVVRYRSAAEKAAAAAGWSTHTYARAKEVFDRAEAGDPVAKEALEEMDRTGKVSPAWRKVTDTPTPPRVDRIDITKTRNRQDAEAKKKRLAKGIYGLEGTAQGFTEVDLRYVFAVTDQDELFEWDRILAQASRSIGALRKRLKEGKATT